MPCLVQPLTGILERKSSLREIKQPRNPINRSVDIAGNKNSLVTDYLIKNGTASLRPPIYRRSPHRRYAQMQTELGFDENTCDSASSAYGAFQTLVKSQLSSLWKRCNHNEVRVYERRALFHMHTPGKHPIFLKSKSYRIWNTIL